MSDKILSLFEFLNDGFFLLNALFNQVLMFCFDLFVGKLDGEMAFEGKCTIIPLDFIIIFFDDFGGHQDIDCIIYSPFNIALIFLDIGEIIDKDARSIRVLYFSVFFQQDFKLFGDEFESFDLFLITLILRFCRDIIQIIFLHDLDMSENFLQLVSWRRECEFIRLLLILLKWHTHLDT